MSIPSDIDLTLKMDFSKEEPIPKSISLPKDVKDFSYKRYNEYKNDYISSTVGSDWTLDLYDSRSTGITSTSIDDLFENSSQWKPWGFDIVKVEERVCWRKLYKDPRVYSQSHTSEEWEDIYKNWNFPLGSKQDRLNIKKELEDKKRDNYYNCCECCGKKLNYNNCLSYHMALCQRCLYYFYNENELRSVRL